MKYLTFSYDDGVTQDVRLIKLFDKYGLKCTFNLNSGLLGQEGHLIRDGVRVDHTKVPAADVASVYAGHEVAVHSRTHPNLADLTDDGIVDQVEGDRLRLSELAGYEVTSMAYPAGDNAGRVADVVGARTGVSFARLTDCSGGFEPQTDDMFRYRPTVYHRDFDFMFELGRRFLDLKTDKKQVFYIWGHSYEFDINDSWGRFEEFCEMMSGRPDIVYCTNRVALFE